MRIESKISILEDGNVIPAAPETSVHSSLDWNGFVVEHHQLPKGELPEHTILDHRLTITTGQTSIPFEFKENGRWHSVQLHPGSFSMQSHGDLGAPRWLKDYEFLAIAIKPEFYRKITAMEIEPAEVELITQRGKQDINMQSFSNLFHHELQHNGYNGQLYGEVLSMAFAMYLLNNYSGGSKKITEPKGKLHGIQLKNLIDYVLCNLDKEISLDVLSAQVFLSPYHFAKIFKNTTRLSPHQFILKIRINKALEMIKLKSLSLTEIALVNGFYDQSHFTHSFKRVVGISPKKYQKTLF